MPFDPAVKTRMFVRSDRYCCLCLKHCGTNIEAAHIIDEASGGSNCEDNGIPLCFDCHQEVGSYNDSHPRGNKIRPEELRARRDRVYALVQQRTLDILQPASLPRLFERRMELKVGARVVTNPSVAELLIAVDALDCRSWDEAYMILVDCAWDNAYVQARHEPTQKYRVEYRDGATQLHFRTAHQVGIETVKLTLLSYMRDGDELLRHALQWQDVTAKVTRALLTRQQHPAG